MTRRRLRRRGAVALAAAALALLLALPGPASARKPIISHVEGNQLFLYDAEREKEEGPLPIPIADPNTFRYGISLNGRYVFFNDANKKLHLFDRAKKEEISLPGIDIYMNPGFLTVSSFGLLAFDNNGNGPAVVYNGLTGSFQPTGFPAVNGHRQTVLSAFGTFLATTCMTDCVADLGNDTAPFVQDLIGLANTGAPNVVMSDEEDPCIDQVGRLAGWNRPNPMQKDVFVYDRGEAKFIDLTGLNSAVDDDTFCVLDAGGDYVAFQRENVDQMLLWERETRSLVPLPATVEAPGNNNNQRFSVPRCRGKFATIIGTAGRDKFKGTSANDVILGLEGKDKLSGRKGNDVICGGDGKDRIRGGKGKDRLLGEKGSDDLHGGDGKDVLKGGKGRDDERQ